MELHQSEEDVMYHRRKKRWMSYGRALSAIGILGLITVTLYVLTRTKFSEESKLIGDIILTSRQIVEAQRDVAVSHELNRKIFRRSAEHLSNLFIGDSQPMNNKGDIVKNPE